MGIPRFLRSRVGADPTLLAIFLRKVCVHTDWRSAGAMLARQASIRRRSDNASGGRRLSHCLWATNRSESICKKTQFKGAFLAASY